MNDKLNILLKMILAALGLVAILALLPLTAPFFLALWLVISEYGLFVGGVAIAIFALVLGANSMHDGHHISLYREYENEVWPPRFRTVLSWVFNEENVTGINTIAFGVCIALLVLDIAPAKAAYLIACGVASLLYLCLLGEAYRRYKAFLKIAKHQEGGL